MGISTLVLQAEIARVQRLTSGDTEAELRRRAELVKRRRGMVNALLARGRKVMGSAEVIPDPASPLARL